MKQILKVATISTVFVALFSACASPAASNTQTGNTNTVNDSTAKTIVVDVRSPEEFAGDGHADCSVNYPLDQFSTHIEELKGYDKVVLVCASGMRAGTALQMLNEAGYTRAENAGPWQNAVCSGK